MCMRSPHEDRSHRVVDRAGRCDASPSPGRGSIAQLFSFVVVSAVLIHHGNSEPKDRTERIERSVEKMIRTMLREAGLPQRSTQ